eukprot:3438463-Heterocapsa_arctica.AAC.1
MDRTIYEVDADFHEVDMSNERDYDDPHGDHIIGPDDWRLSGTAAWQIDEPEDPGDLDWWERQAFQGDSSLVRLSQRTVPMAG